jgi:hypothetical protein
VNPALKVALLELMRRRSFRDYREFFTFMIRQELRGPKDESPG